MADEILCEPCCKIGSKAMDPALTREATLRLLCAILTALTGGGGGGELVVVTSVTPGVGPLNLGKAEDAPHVSGDVGVEVLTKRTDAAASSAGTDGDYATLNTDALGRVWTNAFVNNGGGAAAVNIQDGGNSITVDGSVTVGGTVAVSSLIPGVGATDLGKAEDAPHVSGDTGVAIWAVRQDTWAAFTNTAGDYSPISVTQAGAIRPDISSDWQESSAKGLLKREDDAHSNLDAGVFALGVRATTPATSTSTDGDYSQLTTNPSGVLYAEPSNQAATYATSITAGAAGGITTTGASVLTNAAKAKIISVLNTTDVTILISADAGSTYPYPVPAGTGVFAIDLGANGRWTASNIHAKSLGSNSSSGSLYVGLTI